MEGEWRDGGARGGGKGISFLYSIVLLSFFFLPSLLSSTGFCSLVFTTEFFPSIGIHRWVRMGKNFSSDHWTPFGTYLLHVSGKRGKERKRGERRGDACIISIASQGLFYVR